MSLASKPENSFPEFIRTYYDACKERYPNIQAIAGKWDFEDLIPGLSDFDARFICRNGMTVDDWCKLSTEAGIVHLEICRANHRWYRMLEHSPGINLTWEELADERTYYPEYRQWTVYHSEGDIHREVFDELHQRPWEVRDEAYHLNRFATYYGPYDRSIDVAVNLGVYETKYMLHSRLMHYFAPPVQGAVSLLLGRNIRGKMESLRLACKSFPELSILPRVIDIVESHYECDALYCEPDLSLLEAELYSALTEMGRSIGDRLTLIPPEGRSDPASWKQSLRQADVDLAFRLSERVKWSRLFKGRLYFYGNAPEDFDISHLIPSQLRLMGNTFCTLPFILFVQERRGVQVESAGQAIDVLAGDLISDTEARELKRILHIAFNPYDSASPRKAALEAAELYDNLLRCLFRLLDCVLGRR